MLSKAKLQGTFKWLEAFGTIQVVIIIHEFHFHARYCFLRTQEGSEISNKIFVHLTSCKVLSSGPTPPHTVDWFYHNKQ